MTPSRSVPLSGALLLVVDPRRFWPVLALRGALAIAFGVIALLWPQVTTLALALLFGAYALLDGVGLLLGGFRHPAGQRPDRTHRLAHVVGGLLGITAGVLTAVWPDLTVLTLAVLAGAWAVVTGLVEIVAAVRLRQQIHGELLLAAAGLASVILGLLILVSPRSGALALAVVLGAYAPFVGVLLLAVALRLRRLPRTAAGH